MESYYEAKLGHCPACSQSGFTVTGFYRHLNRDGGRTLCGALYRQYNATQHPSAPPFANEEDMDYMEVFIPSEPPSPADSCMSVDQEETPLGTDCSDDEANYVAGGWEPEVEPQSEGENLRTEGSRERNTDAFFAPSTSPDERRAAEERVGSGPKVTVRFSETFPQSKAGCPHSRTTSAAHADGTHSNVYAPFASRMEWEVAKWAKLWGSGSTAFSELLAIDGLCDTLNLSYSNTNQLNAIIDNCLPSRPEFYRREVVAGGEAFEFYARDPIECIKALWGDPEFVDELVFEPIREYADEDKTIRLYHDMHTGKWWWKVQKSLNGKPGATVVPIVISSDKTRLTTFHGKVAYPVYITIGNLPKHVRRKPSRAGQMLLAYLPATKLGHVTNKSARRRMLANLFHACMGYIMKPLKAAGENGVDLQTADGAIRRCHPIFAAFVGDYPEQLLVTCIKTGHCPTCPADKNGCGDYGSAEDPRELAPITKALDSIRDGGTAFTKACADAGIRPIQQPFWKNLPSVNIYKSIVPDILHQLHQGVVKHLVGWLRSVFGDKEIDARCRRLPPSHNIRLFMKGLSPLSRVTGTEHDQIARILLGLVVDLRLPDNQSPARLLCAVRALLDFLYLAQYPLHSDETLELLEDALETFHKNKEIFVELGIRSHFDIPKLHSLGHYRFYIEAFGTTDNYNTAYTERLHIDYAKDAYRSTNRKDEYTQMTAWLGRREKILQHDRLIKRRLEGWASARPMASISRPVPLLVYPRTQKMAVGPSARAVSIDKLHLQYGAVNFEAALARYVYLRNHPHATRPQLETWIQSFYPPFHWAVFHRIKFTHQDPFKFLGDSATPQIVDSIHVQPARRDKRGGTIPGRFDTALIRLDNANPDNSNARTTSAVGRVRCVFTIPPNYLQQWFTQETRPKSTHFAYVDWFTEFPVGRRQHHGLYRISPLRRNQQQQSSIASIAFHLSVGISNHHGLYRISPLRRNQQQQSSMHLFPSFGPVANRDWKSDTTLDESQSFYVNPFSSRFMYSSLY